MTVGTGGGGTARLAVGDLEVQAGKLLKAGLAPSTEKTYSTSQKGWIRCNLSFSLLKSAIMCIRGCRSTVRQPAPDMPIDLVAKVGHVPQIN